MATGALQERPGRAAGCSSGGELADDARGSALKKIIGWLDAAQRAERTARSRSHEPGGVTPAALPACTSD